MIYYILVSSFRAHGADFSMSGYTVSDHFALVLSVKVGLSLNLFSFTPGLNDVSV